MTQKERQNLIEEKSALEAKISTADFISPSDLRRVSQINSLLLTNGENDKIAVIHGGQKCDYFSKRSMSGFTNRRR